jgi:hypothetical protein
MAELYLDADKMEVEANSLTPENAEALAIWCGGVAVVEHDAFNHAQTYAGVNVPTFRGMQRASEGDWIVRNAKGFFYIVKHHKFQELFEPLK